jgi:hypothetical protein
MGMSDHNMVYLSELLNTQFLQCWISKKYASERLWLHYFWIFVAMFGTITLYTVIYSTLNIRMRPKSTSSISSLVHPSSAPSVLLDFRTINRAARYMIIYPTIYVLCTLPLAAGRMASMTGRHIPYWYYCVAGAAITSSGWLDVLLYAFTRRALIFSDTPATIDECGLETFGIFRTSEGLWSVRTTVEGGVLVDSSVSTRRREHYKKNLTNNESNWYDHRSRDGLLDDTFELARPGIITTKTTITVTTKPKTATLDQSADGISAPSRRSPNRADLTPSVHSAANSTTDTEHGKDY